ncbi:hypothetical protein [Mucisphaera calidilacus]|uniref:Uncharacterized protein n=1 Tax=Mucisphaera calidilacus TaxID=2527982 RepID=A0A518BWF9_9BACT|nr:hypothetical protein [Mucisphaera calidilacus]QDU71308.1 hypothetical protein Pan265_11570 [Mucisphaera calidilacus]
MNLHVLLADERLRKYGIPTGAALLAILSLCVGSYLWWSMQMPAMPETPDDVRAMLEDSRLRHLSPDRREAYAQKAFAIVSSMEGDQRGELFGALRENQMARDNMRMMMQQMMVDRARAYALADEAEREQILADSVERMRAMRPPGGGRPEGGRPEGNRGGGGDRQSRFMDRAATGNPQHGQMMREFFQAMREYREKNNIEGGRGGGAGRGDLNKPA